MPFAGHTTDGLHDPLRWRFRMQGFLSHLHSLMVTMSQKSFVPQADKSVSQVLMSDTQHSGRVLHVFHVTLRVGVRGVNEDTNRAGGRHELAQELESLGHER